ncbi:peptidylprolyl isomerase [Uliginosibacterium paludis]|uniref:Peptidyl-prolyl cis-trans isomerase n=1 Tax=Uliginosibacterium paludis TaxID=1615952 RepID=A0ABV2CKS8_9RHOO
MKYLSLDSGRRLFLALAASLAALSALPVSAQDTAPQVRVTTSLGAFTLELDPLKAPETVANFLRYVDDKHYDGTIFHRVIKDFMIQGGGMLPDMSEKPTRAPIRNEARNGLKNLRGSVAMARTGAPHSATSQFFVNTVDNSFLDAPGQDGWGYAVFGRVVAGMDVVDKIRNVSTRSAGMYQDVPATPVVIQSMRRANEAR